MILENTESSDSEKAVNSRRYLILVVEDVRMIHDVIARTLRDLDAELVIAVDGATGLQEVEKALPDLVILDLALPVVDGWEVLRRLRADARTAHVPVLVMTAHGQSGLEQDVLDSGANAFLNKPFHPKKLRAAVHELLGLI